MLYEKYKINEYIIFIVKVSINYLDFSARNILYLYDKYTIHMLCI